MNLDMQAPLPTDAAGVTRPKTASDYPTRLADIVPGSQIRIGGPRVGGAPFDAIVLQTLPEWGATGEPAVLVSTVADQTELVISQAARYDVTVIADATQFINDTVPANAVEVNIKPVRGIAMRFVGGVENATEIIRWALGRGAPFYNRGDDENPETITFGGIGASAAVARLGDWIILHEDGTFHIHSNLDNYDRI
jgi:hypothetical protein